MTIKIDPTTSPGLLNIIHRTNAALARALAESAALQAELDKSPARGGREWSEVPQ